jgi:hypothetical protein
LFCCGATTHAGEVVFVVAGVGELSISSKFTSVAVGVVVCIGVTD